MGLCLFQPMKGVPKFPTCFRTGVAALSLLGLVIAAPGAEKVFFGNLHSHTSYSDGSGTPREAFTHARDAANLDFLAITEHNHRSADGPGDRQDGLLNATDPSLYNRPDGESLLSADAQLSQ